MISVLTLEKMTNSVQLVKIIIIQLLLAIYIYIIYTYTNYFFNHSRISHDTAGFLCIQYCDSELLRVRAGRWEGGGLWSPLLGKQFTRLHTSLFHTARKTASLLDLSALCKRHRGVIRGCGWCCCCAFKPRWR